MRATPAVPHRTRTPPSSLARLLVIAPEGPGQANVIGALASLDCEIETATSASEAAARLGDARAGFALAVAVEQSEFDAAAVLQLARPPGTPAVILGQTHEPTAPFTDVVRFVADPFVPQNLAALVREILRRRGEASAGQDVASRADREVGRLQNRQRLLDAVVAERTQEIADAYAKLKVSSREAILALAQAIEARDPYTKGHSARVARYAVALARETRYPEPELEALEFAAFLHDVGKIGVRDAVLLKAGALDDDEWKHMRKHPVLGYEIAVNLEMMRPLLGCIRNHHERWDGKGYPDGLAGEQIPLSARIVAIADAFDAMSTDRPYKAALTLDESAAAFMKQRGLMYEPHLVDLFIERVIGEMRLA